MIAFTGSRHLTIEHKSLIQQVVRSSCATDQIGVGDASGADALVRGSLPADLTRVFHSADRRPFALAIRSQEMVRAASSLIAFADRACPSGLVPGPQPFNGFGSGTWATIAYAIHLGKPVTVFVCGAFCLPAWDGGAWKIGPWYGAENHVWMPAQTTLF